MSGAPQGSFAPGQTMLGVEPLVGAGDECAAVIAYTGKRLDRWPLSEQSYADGWVTLMECDEAQTIVCASHGVAVLADSSSDTADAVFVRFDPRGSSKDVSAPTPLPESATLLSAAVAPDAQLLIGGTRSGQVKVWSLAPENAGTLLHTFEGHGHAWVSCVAVISGALHCTVSEEHPDAKYVAVSGSWHGTAFAHFISESSFASVQLVRPDGEGALASDDLTITAVDVSPGGSLVATGDRTGEVILWDAASGEVEHTMRPHGFDRYGVENPDTSVTAVKFHPARYWVMVARRDQEAIAVEDLESQELEHTVYMNTNAISLRCASWVGDTTRIVGSCGHSFALYATEPDTPVAGDWMPSNFDEDDSDSRQ